MTRAQQQTVLQALADVVGMCNGGVILPEVMERSNAVLMQAVHSQMRMKDALRELALRTTVIVQTVNRNEL